MVTPDLKKMIKLFGDGKITKQQLDDFKKESTQSSAMEKILDNMVEAILKKAEKGAPGENGLDGINGEDGEDGKDGKDGRDGKDGKDGKNGLDGKNGKNGVDGNDGKDGKDGKAGEDGSPDTPQEVRDKLSKLKGDDRLDAKNIKNLPQLDLDAALGRINLPEPRIERVVQILVSDPNGSAITTGDGKAYFKVPGAMQGMKMIDVSAHLTTASTSGVPTIQLRNSTQGIDMLSTRITIDALETDSDSSATLPIINPSNNVVFDGDIINVDIDIAGTNAKGLLVEMVFKPA